MRFGAPRTAATVIPPDDQIGVADVEAAVSTEHGRQHAAASRNTVALLASRLAVAAMGWAGTVLIARLLSPSDWGVFSFVFGLLGMMSIVTDLGVGRVVLSRLVDAADEHEADVVARSFVTLRVALGFLGYLIAVGYVVLMGYSAEAIRATALAGLVVVIATPSHGLSVLYQSRLKLATVAMAEAAAQFLQLILTILAAISMPMLLVFILPAIANELFSGTWKYVGVRRGWVGTRLRAGTRFRLWREMLVEAVPLSVGLGMITLLSKVDVLMLAQLDDFESVGLYVVAYKFADLVTYAVLAVVTPVATLLVAAWPAYPDVFRTRMLSATVMVGLLTCLAVVAMWAPAKVIVELLYGERFGAAANATRLLLAGAVFAAVSHVILVALVAAGRQRAYPWVALGALLLNIGLNIVLIPRFSYTGSASATVVTELAMLVAMGVLLHRSLPVRRLLPLGRLALMLGLTVLVCVVTVTVNDLDRLPWSLVSAVSVVMFAGGAWALRLVDRSTVIKLFRSDADRT